MKKLIFKQLHCLQNCISSCLICPCMRKCIFHCMSLMPVWVCDKVHPSNALVGEAHKNIGLSHVLKLISCMTYQFRIILSLVAMPSKQLKSGPWVGHVRCYHWAIIYAHPWAVHNLPPGKLMARARRPEISRRKSTICRTRATHLLASREMDGPCTTPGDQPENVDRVPDKGHPNLLITGHALCVAHGPCKTNTVGPSKGHMQCFVCTVLSFLSTAENTQTMVCLKTVYFSVKLRKVNLIPYAIFAVDGQVFFLQ